MAAAVVADHDHGIHTQTGCAAGVAHGGHLVQDLDPGLAQERQHRLRAGSGGFNAVHALVDENLQVAGEAFRSARLTGNVQIDAESLAASELAAVPELLAELIRVGEAGSHDEPHATGVYHRSDIVSIGDLRTHAATENGMTYAEQFGDAGLEQCFTHGGLPQALGRPVFRLSDRQPVRGACLGSCRWCSDHWPARCRRRPGRRLRRYICVRPDAALCLRCAVRQGSRGDENPYVG
ncbi:hypothetical protein D3C85_1271610 [compost metagenome]